MGLGPEITVNCALKITAGITLQLAGDCWNLPVLKVEVIYTPIEEVVPAKATSKDTQQLDFSPTIAFRA